jgi:hypothetical protein
MAQIDTRKPFPSETFIICGLVSFCLVSVGCSVLASTPKPSTTPAGSYSISGIVGPAVDGSGAKLVLTGNTTAIAIADEGGNYNFQGLADGVYTITPSKSGANFNPPNQIATLHGASLAGINFRAKLPSTAISISGIITPAPAGSGSTVTLSGTTTVSVAADSSGRFSFGDIPSGSYNVTPTKTGVKFSPPSESVVADSSDVGGIDFKAIPSTAATISISGTISPAILGSGATVALGGEATMVTKADSFGNYNFAGVSAGVYTVTPSKTGATFDPPNRTIIAGSNVENVDFGGHQAPVSVSISGTVGPVTQGAGVTVRLSGASSATTITDSLGNYSFTDLSAGSYTLTPTKTGLKFAPATQQVTAATASISGINFSAGSSIENSGPIVIKGQNGTVIQGLKITSTTGDCVTISQSTNITIQNSEIGPCAGNAIKIMGGSGIKIFDSYIHPETQSPGCCDHNDGVFATKGPSNLWIQGNVIAYGESNIEVHGGTSVYVIGNLLLNPRGPYPRGQNFQCWNSCSGVSVQNNYALSSTDTAAFLYPEGTEDSVNFGVSDTFVVQNNFISGGHSSSGCGIMADTKSTGGQILQNRLLDTGQCGIGLTDGTHTASGNLIYNSRPVPGGGNTAMYVAHYGQSGLCGPMIVTDNIADEVQSNGYHSGWWNRGDCGPIPTGTNRFGASADTQLTPTALSPPLIPPQPKNCVVFSPYSNQTSAPACAQ